MSSVIFSYSPLQWFALILLILALLQLLRILWSIKVFFRGLEVKRQQAEQVLRKSIEEVRKKSDREQLTLKDQSAEINEQALPIIEVSRPLPYVQFGANSQPLLWQPTSGSLLEFALSQGVNLPSRCRMGVCHTCKTKVSDGEFEFIRQPRRKPEEGYCLPCISIPVSNLTLDC